VLCLSKRTEYALTALAYMAGRGERVSSAREIAGAYGLPLALLMKILKCMQHHGLLNSTRGVRGGYRLVADLEETTLFDLVAMMECPDKPGAECGCMDHAADPMTRVRLSRSEPAQGPALALQYRLIEFLKNVKLSDLVTPGRRIDLPAGPLSVAGLAPNWRHDHAHSAD
jgi:Rrf2 family protein